VRGCLVEGVRRANKLGESIAHAVETGKDNLITVEVGKHLAECATEGVEGES
jgi:ribosomal protein S5